MNTDNDNLFISGDMDDLGKQSAPEKMPNTPRKLEATTTTHRDRGNNYGGADVKDGKAGRYLASGAFLPDEHGPDMWEEVIENAKQRTAAEGYATPPIPPAPEPRKAADPAFTWDGLVEELKARYAAYFKGRPDHAKYEAAKLILHPDGIPWRPRMSAELRSLQLDPHLLLCKFCGDAGTFCVHNPYRAWKTAEEWQAEIKAKVNAF